MNPLLPAFRVAAENIVAAKALEKRSGIRRADVHRRHLKRSRDETESTNHVMRSRDKVHALHLRHVGRCVSASLDAAFPLHLYKMLR